MRWNCPPIAAASDFTDSVFRTNVEGLRNVLDVAVEKPIAAAADLRKFVFTSTYATVDRRHDAWAK